jgi:hypothetical protein
MKFAATENVLDLVTQRTTTTLPESTQSLHIHSLRSCHGRCIRTGRLSCEPQAAGGPCEEEVPLTPGQARAAEVSALPTGIPLAGGGAGEMGVGPSSWQDDIPD